MMKLQNSTLILTSDAVLLPGIKNPSPATIGVDQRRETITTIHEGHADYSEEKYKGYFLLSFSKLSIHLIFVIID